MGNKGSIIKPWVNKSIVLHRKLRINCLNFILLFSKGETRPDPFSSPIQLSVNSLKYSELQCLWQCDQLWFIWRGALTLKFLTMIFRKLFQVARKLLEERWLLMYTVSAQRQNSYPTFKLSHRHYHPLFAVPSFMIRLRQENSESAIFHCAF